MHCISVSEQDALVTWHSRLLQQQIQDEHAHHTRMLVKVTGVTLEATQNSQILSPLQCLIKLLTLHEKCMQCSTSDVMYLLW